MTPPTDSSVTFNLLKIVKESKLGFDMEYSIFSKGDPRIRVDKRQIINIWNDQYETSLIIKQSYFECCVFTKPAVLITWDKRLGNDIKIICFIDDIPENVLKLTTLLKASKKYHDMKFVYSFTNNDLVLPMHKVGWIYVSARAKLKSSKSQKLK
jgi:hypothetical protein